MIDCAADRALGRLIAAISRAPNCSSRAPPSPGYTKRPARVQFMLGQVVLYRDDTSARYRPDSKRPRAGTARRRHPGRWKDLTGSDKRRPHCGWPVRSCCITMISIRSIVQTRAALKRRRVGLQRAERSGCKLSLPGGGGFLPCRGDRRFRMRRRGCWICRRARCAAARAPDRSSCRLRQSPP